MILRRSYLRKRSSKRKISDIIFTSSPRKTPKKPRNSNKELKVPLDDLKNSAKKGANLAFKQQKLNQDALQPKKTMKLLIKPVNIDDLQKITSNKGEHCTQDMDDLNLSSLTLNKGRNESSIFVRKTRSSSRMSESLVEVNKSINQELSKQSNNTSVKNSKKSKTVVSPNLQNKNPKKTVENSEVPLNKKTTKTTVAKQISEEVSFPDSMSRRRSLRIRHHPVEPNTKDTNKNISQTKKQRKRSTMKTITKNSTKGKNLQTKKPSDSDKKNEKNTKLNEKKVAEPPAMKDVTNKISKTKTKRKHTIESASKTPKQKNIRSQSDNFSSPIPQKNYLKNVSGVPIDDLHLTLFMNPKSPYGGNNPISSTPIVNSKMIKNKSKSFKKPLLKGTIDSKIPTKGSLKRKRWIMNTLKEKNDGYEDDLFESKNFGQFNEMIPLDDSDVSMWSIATPKCAFLVTPNICAKSPRFKDCYSPSELLKARKVAEEVMHMRNKKRKSESGLNPSFCENLTSKLNSSSKSDGELPEKKKLEYLEMIQSIPKSKDILEEEDESDKDDYFSDAES